MGIKRAVLFAALLLSALSPAALAADAEPSVAPAEVYVAAPGELPCAAREADGQITGIVAPESTLYFPVQNAQRAEDLSSLRAFVQWEGDDAVLDTPRIEYRQMYSADGSVSRGYRYVVALPLHEAPDTEPGRAAGRVWIARRASVSSGARAFSLVLGDVHDPSSSDTVLCQSRDLVLEFGDVGDTVSLQFYSMGHFEVDVRGQQALNIGCSTEPFTDYLWRYPEASLRFLYWTRPPVFDRAGLLYLYAGPDDRLYEIRNGRLAELTELYQPDQEAFVVETRRLGAYILSDRELPPGRPLPAQENPPTGAKYE